MNERIKELAEQATTLKFDGTGMDAGKKVLDNNLFAELIIRETTKTIIKSYRGHINPDIALNAVEEHFGVYDENQNL